MFGDIAQLGSLLESSQRAEDARLEAAGKGGIVQGVSKGRTIVHTAIQHTAGTTKAEGGVGSPAPAPTTSEKDPKCIWDDSDVVGDVSISPAEVDDGRAAPDYDILYKQAVNSGDVFLGMSGKTPGSRDCEIMVVKIKFPGEKFKDLDLDVQRQQLRASSPNYRLNVYLPHPVDHNEGKARFDAAREMLVIDLPILRDDNVF